VSDSFLSKSLPDDPTCFVDQTSSHVFCWSGVSPLCTAGTGTSEGTGGVARYMKGFLESVVIHECVHEGYRYQYYIYIYIIHVKFVYRYRYCISRYVSVLYWSGLGVGSLGRV
jgi:hypothetical protein